MAQVRIIFDEGGSNEYVFLHVFHISDPKEGMKATVIRGNRGDGSIIIPGGKKSQEIRIRGKIVEETYEAITSKMNEMRTKVTTDTATLKMQTYTGGSWVSDWEYNVRRINPIRFPESLRIASQEYEVVFLVLLY